MTTCFACGAEVLSVALTTCTRTVEPRHDPVGTVEIRRSGLGWRGRMTGANTPLASGWTSKHVPHTCKQPMEASA